MQISSCSTDSAAKPLQVAPITTYTHRDLKVPWTGGFMCIAVGAANQIVPTTNPSVARLQSRAAPHCGFILCGLAAFFVCMEFCRKKAGTNQT